MLIYNTTYHVEEEAVKNFLIWIREAYIPQVQKSDLLCHPRLYRILSHLQEGGESFSLQWEVEDSAKLHQWHISQGASLNKELADIFKDKVVSLPTLMEVMEE